DDEVQYQRKRLTERLNEQPRWDVRDDYHWNQPAKNEPEQPRKNDIWITRDIEKVEIAIHQSLGPNDPKADCSQAEPDRVMHGDSENKRDNRKQKGKRVWHDAELGQRKNNHGGAKQSVDDAVEPELFGGYRKLAVDWQHQHRIQFSRAHELGNVCDIHKKERLE